MDEKILVLIPARMGSSRFPGKPLEKILGIPMIGHVFKNVSEADHVSLTAVATCDEAIANYVSSIGGKAVMTSNKHDRASDRCAEALIALEQEVGYKYDIVVMVQGDEPMTHQDMVKEAVSPMLNDPKIKVVNLLADIKTEEEFLDKNCIKVVCDCSNNALYFSRQPIPSKSFSELSRATKQVCVIPFRRDFLIEYTKMKPTPLEEIESVDMMRILEHGQTVKMIPTKYQTYAVDTIEDLRRVETIMSKGRPNRGLNLLNE